MQGLLDSRINIQGLEDYVMPAPEDKLHLQTWSDEESEDYQWLTDIIHNRSNNHSWYSFWRK